MGGTSLRLGVAALAIGVGLAIVVTTSSRPAGAASLNAPVVGMASTQGGGGYWLVAADGGVFSFGDATFFGSMGGHPLNRPVVEMAAADNHGYWLVAADGGIFSFGEARFHGSTGNLALHRPVVGMAATPDGGGYWLVASDGGIFAFGDAQFYGSMGGHPLNHPVVGMAATPNGGGYWLVASDGGIFAFGDARFFGSTGSLALNQPIVGMSASPDGGGYRLVASDGGIFSFGDTPFYGSASGQWLPGPVIAVATDPATDGYWLVTSQGQVQSFAARFLGEPTQVLIVGDSLVWQAYWAIQQAFDDSGRFNVAIYADPGDGLVSPWAQGALATSEVNPDNQIIVIATESVDTEQVDNQGLSLGTYETVAAQDVASAGKRCVLIVQPKTDVWTAYYSPPTAQWMQAVNNQIAAQHQNVRVVQWQQEADANPSWFGPDMLHFWPQLPEPFTGPPPGPWTIVPGEIAFGQAMASGAASC